jgi:hypothetical protein
MSITLEEAWEQTAREAYEKELIEDALKEISYDGISHYLFRYGHAIQTRVEECLKSARDLHKGKYYGPSIVCSCTAVEVTIRYFILRPLMQGAFLSDEWAEVLTGRIVSGKTHQEKDMLPSILRFWKMDINGIKLTSGEYLWAFYGQIWTARNKYVHQGNPVPRELSAKAIKAATLLVKLANDVLVKALGWKKGKHRFGSEKNGQSPFA